MIFGSVERLFVPQEYTAGCSETNGKTRIDAVWLPVQMPCGYPLAMIFFTLQV